MNVWMKIEETALNDPRIRMLAKRMNKDYAHAFLACCQVWHRLYQKEGGLLTHEEIDIATDILGFADLLVLPEVGLAEVVQDGLRVKGSSRVKALAAMNSRKKPSDSVSELAHVSQLPPIRASESSSLLDPNSDPDPDAREAASWLEWFNREFKRGFKLRDSLIRNVRALRKAGFTQEDMRKVSLLKKAEWENKPEMSRNLVPMTLLRIGTFGEYLDRASESISSRQTGFQGVDAPRVPYEPKRPVLAIVENPVSRDEVKDLVGSLVRNLKGGGR